MEKAKVTMRNWEPYVYDGEYNLSGTADVHPRLGRNVYVATTSTLVKASLEEDVLIYETRNTVYHCPLKYMMVSPYENVVQEYREELARLDTSENALDRIIAAAAKMSLGEPEDTADEMVRKIRALQETGQQEIDEAGDGTKYLVIHSGSRNLGKQVAELYQKLAINLDRGYGDYLEKRDEIIRTYKEQGRRSEIQDALKQLHWQVYESETSMPEDLCYLSGKYLEDYLHDVEICQAFARRSREKMAEIILERTGMAGREAFHTIHNYIDTDEMILRKGAIAAHSGEKVLIPINMRDGSVLAVGKGNPEWNYSAPHGAGRLMSRTKAKANLSMDEYRETMKGIYTTSINENTLDEAPMAYKSLEDIIDVIRESVDVIDVMKPIYNFKASD